MIYRGFSRLREDGLEKNIHRETPRQPRDTAPSIHEAADAWFLERFGVKARSQTLICTTDIEQASSYGLRYRVLPEGDFSIIYSKKVKDFLTHEIEQNNPQEIAAWLEQMEYEKVSSICCIDKNFRGEVMLDCALYRVFRV